MGRMLNPSTGKPRADIVHILKSHGQNGPAENAFIIVEMENNTFRARYITWITYFDVEYAAAYEPDLWVIVEPSENYEKDVVWLPYGWTDAIKIPTVGDNVIEITSQAG